MSSCGDAPAISAGTWVVVGDTATYTCNTGYKMEGRPHITCTGGVWPQTLPQCYLINSEPANNFWMNIFNNQDEVPKWLIILMGVVAGLAALLTICCLIAVCWRLCCNSKVSPVELDEGAGVTNKCCRCFYGFKRKRRSKQESDNNTHQSTEPPHETLDHKNQVLGKNTNKRMGNSTRILSLDGTTLDDRNQRHQ